MDTSGIDLNAVGTAIRGMTGWLPSTVTIPSASDMADPNYVLSGSWLRLGLRTTDGAPDFSESPATLLEMYEAGYKINPGTGTAQVTQIFAQFDDTLRQAIRGEAPSSGVLDVDVDATPTGTLFLEDIFRMADASYKILRRCAPALISSVKSGKPNRGNIPGTTVIWDIDRSEALGNKHFREAWVSADSTPEPVVWSVTPAGQSVGDDVAITGQNFTGMTGVTIDGTAVVSPLLANDGLIIATIPAGASGAADVIVTTADGSSDAVSYTVG